MLLKEKLPGTLPDKLSERIRLAVHDAQECEKDPRYEVHMGTWHSPGIHSSYWDKEESQGEPPVVCAVCLAGCVMAKTLGATPDGRYTPSDALNYDTQAQLFELDDVRDGTILAGSRVWRGTSIPEYYTTEEAVAAVTQANELVRNNLDHELERAPWPIYLQVADIFAKVGL